MATTWRAGQPNGWNPTIQVQPDGRVLLLYGQGEAWVAELVPDLSSGTERRLAGPQSDGSRPAYAMGWSGPATASWAVLAADGATMERWQASAPAWEPVRATGDPRLVAGNERLAEPGHWATYLAAPHFRVAIDDRPAAVPSGGALSMAWPWVAHAASNENATIARHLHGLRQHPDLPTLVPMNFLKVGPQGHTAYGNGAVVAAWGSAGENLGHQVVAPWRRESPVKVLDVRGEAWLVTVSWDGERAWFLARPFGSAAALRVELWAVGGDAAVHGDWLVCAGHSDRGALSCTRVALSQALETPPVVVPALPAGYVGYYYDLGKYGSFDPERNMTVITGGMYADGDGSRPPGWQAAMRAGIVAAGAAFVEASDVDVVSDLWDRVHGVMLTELAPHQMASAARSAREIIRQRGLPPRVVVATVRPDDYEAAAGVAEVDWLAVEMYVESPGPQDWWSAQALMERRVRRVIDNTRGRPIVLIGQAYGRSLPISEQALEAYQQVYFDMWRAHPNRVKGVFLFSYARPDGTLGRPNVERWHAAAVRATSLPAVPAVDGGGGGTVPSMTITEPDFSGGLEVATDGKLRCVCGPDSAAGWAPWVEWIWRPKGESAWRQWKERRNPDPSTGGDNDNTFDFAEPGDYELGLRWQGGQTGRSRVMRYQRDQTPEPPQPQPEPVPPTAETLTLTCNDGVHLVGAHDGGGWEGEVVVDGGTVRPKGLAHAGGTAADTTEVVLTIVRGADGVFALRAGNGAVASAQDDGTVVFNRKREPDWKPAGWEAMRERRLAGGKSAIEFVERGTFLYASNQGGGNVGHKVPEHGIGIDEQFVSSIRLSGGGGGGSAALRGLIKCDGRMFRASADNGLFRPVFASALTALAPGKDYAGFFDWCRAIGFNGVRMFAGALSWAGQTADSARANLPKVLQAAADRGLYVEATCLTDTATSPFDKGHHLREVAAIVRGMPHVLIEIANEYTHHTQDGQVHDPNWLKQQVATFAPGGHPVAIGAPEADEPDPSGRWGGVGGHYGTAHLDRGRDKWNQCRRVREIEACSASGRFPVVNNEPLGAADPGTPGQRSSDPDFFYTLGALNRLFEVGGVFHFEDGLHCRTPVGPTQVACAEAFVRASHLMDAIGERLTYLNVGHTGSPLSSAKFNEGRMVDGVPLPGVTRAYSGVSGGRGYTVLVGLGPGDWEPKWANGWQPTGTAGELGGCKVLNVKQG